MYKRQALQLSLFQDIAGDNHALHFAGALIDFGNLSVAHHTLHGILDVYKRQDEKIPAWAFRFLQSIPQVTMVLSGMSNMEQMEENIRTFGEDRPLNEEEMKTLLSIAHEMVGKIALPCTACHYCVSHCPQGLDIPNLLSLYNEHCFTGGGFIAPMALSAIPKDKWPSACIGCRSCEAVYPQQIKISEAMADFAGKLEG